MREVGEEVGRAAGEAIMEVDGEGVVRAAGEAIMKVAGEEVLRAAGEAANESTQDIPTKLDG